MKLPPLRTNARGEKVSIIDFKNVSVAELTKHRFNTHDLGTTFDYVRKLYHSFAITKQFSENK